MRSRTTSDLPGRCPRCWLRLAFCICPALPTVVTRTKVLVVRHERESWKSTGTARVAGLALPNLQFADFDDDPQGVNERLPALDGAALLFPSDAPAPWPAALPTLVVIDGTWRQSRRMVTKLPRLQGLPRLELSAPPARVMRLRDTSFEEGRSTLEAIAEALGRLEGEAVSAPLLRLHADYVERVLKARGVYEQKREAFERQAWRPLQ
ncbi:MAG: DTW domain-containing protein [Myxococcaceae bacterium]|jgi:DTW domain-containing protein YfiP|nr:DTW domain-containing protein [Myxococcaceae bacterium]MCA3014730.1 DTW domain-containing protein [Myxococcaceae bacterium]